MTVDDAMLMSYADGELDAIMRARVEQAMEKDPALAERAAAFATLTSHVRSAFAPIAQAPIPHRLTATLTSNVLAFAPNRAKRPWRAGLALAASLLLGIGLGTRLDNDANNAPFAVHNGTVVASGSLGHALDTQPASASGDIRILVSFRGADGYCRVFAAAITDGIACHSGGMWQLRQTRSGKAASATEYRQASSSDAALMAAAQDMMIGTPLDAKAEARARATGWR